MILFCYCASCKHFHEKDYLERAKNPNYSCDAFPERIPDDIVFGKLVHTKPYKDDNGLQYDEDEEKANRTLSSSELIEEMEKLDRM